MAVFGNLFIYFRHVFSRLRYTFSYHYVTLHPCWKRSLIREHKRSAYEVSDGAPKGRRLPPQCKLDVFMRRSYITRDAAKRTDYRALDCVLGQRNMEQKIVYCKLINACMGLLSWLTYAVHLILLVRNSGGSLLVRTCLSWLRSMVRIRAGTHLWFFRIHVWI